MPALYPAAGMADPSPAVTNLSVCLALCGVGKLISSDSSSVSLMVDGQQEREEKVSGGETDQKSCCHFDHCYE